MDGRYANGPPEGSPQVRSDWQATHAARPVSHLGAEVLAAARTAGTENLAAARSSLAGEETVATGAHEVRGLESPLHRMILR